jgi:hypothetical protein
MSLLYFERAEYRFPSRASLEIREFVAQEYPNESVEWVLRTISSPGVRQRGTSPERISPVRVERPRGTTQLQVMTDRRDR